MGPLKPRGGHSVGEACRECPTPLWSIKLISSHPWYIELDRASRRAAMGQTALCLRTVIFSDLVNLWPLSALADDERHALPRMATDCSSRGLLADKEAGRRMPPTPSKALPTDCLAPTASPRNLSHCKRVS
jgi:hypothetical protein